MTEIEFLKEVGEILCNIDKSNKIDTDLVNLPNMYLYSIGCLNGLMSLHDNDFEFSENNQCNVGSREVSVQHLKIRVADIVSCLEKSSNNEVNLDSSENKNDFNSLDNCDENSNNFLIENVYELYFKAGFFYHKNNKVKASIPKTATVGKVSFVRSTVYSPSYKMSGAGIYTTSNEPNNLLQANKVQDMFGLSKVSCKTLYEAILKNSIFKDNDNIDKFNLRYLSLKIQNGTKYWTDKEVYSDKGINLVREDKINSRRYYLAKRQDKKIKFCNLSEYFCSGTEYIPLARAILETNKTLPTIKFRTVNRLVFIQLGYLLPPAEQNFFELYSWPIKNSVFYRIMHIDVFVGFKTILERTGYVFTDGDL